MARKNTNERTEEVGATQKETPEVEQAEVVANEGGNDTQEEQAEQKENAEEVGATTEATQEETSDVATEATQEVSPEVERLMKLYPNLEKMWITPNGFVHPEGVPEHYRKGATLYTNKYFNN